MSTLWKLSAEGPRDLLTPAYDRLTDAESPAALSVSLFERPQGLAALEALFDAAPDEAAFFAAAGLDPDALDDVIAAPLPEEDWVALSLAGLPPVPAGRFWLHGSHHTQAPPEGAIPILIEANQAFGTGHHGTTRGCLIAYDRLISGGATFANVLDLGCGSGVLAMAAARTLPDAAIIATDNDPLAIEVTDENLAANATPDVETAVAEGMESEAITARSPYDLVFANILAAPLVELAPAIAAACAPGARVILSGLLAEQRGMVLDAWRAAGLTLDDELELEGWATLVMKA